MTALSLIRLGNPILRKKSRQVTKRELRSETFQQFLDELAVLCLLKSGVGIAAPQVGVSKRVIVVNIDSKNPRYPGRKAFPLTIIINPKIIRHSSEMFEDWEGDLSVDLRGIVSRFVTCEVVGLDRNGHEIRFRLTNDFHSRVFQHEIDHLDGVMFVDRVHDTKTLSEYAEWKRYWKR